jgi:Ca2+-binding RTX toxin-like protein
MATINVSPTPGILLNIGSTFNVGALINQIFSGYNFTSYGVWDTAVDNTTGFPPPSTSWGRWFNSTASDCVFLLNGNPLSTGQYQSISAANINNLSVRFGPDIGSYLYFYADIAPSTPEMEFTRYQFLIPLIPTTYTDPTPNVIDASDIVSASFALLNGIGGTLSPNGCHEIARTIAAMVGAPLPMNSGSIVPLENLDGGYWTAVIRGATTNDGWLSALRPGDIVRADYADPNKSQHTFTVLEVNGGLIRSIDNANSNGAILDHWRDYSTIMAPSSVTVYRITETLNTINGSNGNDALVGTNRGDRILGNLGNDQIFAGTGNDTLEGGEGNDTLDGGGGGDTLIGGNGFDLASYANATGGLRVSLSDAAVNSGDAAGDTFNGVEGITGSIYGDDLIGDGNLNQLWGNYGEDVLWGQGGNDQLYGGWGNDWLVGGQGADLLDGGNGFDTARYSYASTGVRASLTNSSVNTGDAAGDTFVGIEALTGSDWGDDLIGDGNFNQLWGDYGDDVLWGQGGNDQLFGGWGNDWLIGGTGADLNDGGGGFDTVRYSFSLTAVIADLANAAVNTGDAAGDTYVDIEALVGSDYNDTLWGNNGDNQVWGDYGSDTINGRGGADILSGGNGLDRFVFETGWGADTILDYKIGGAEKLEFKGISGLSSFGQLSLSATATSLTVSYGGNSILLLGVTTLAAGDVLFTA